MRITRTVRSYMTSQTAWGTIYWGGGKENREHVPWDALGIQAERISNQVLLSLQLCASDADLRETICCARCRELNGKRSEGRSLLRELTQLVADLRN